MANLESPEPELVNMTSHLSPHTLVAIMSKVVGNNHDHIDRYTNLTGDQMVGGLLDDAEGILRTFPLLDAIAGICVSAEKHQVIATAIQLKSVDKKVRLTIAQNGRVDESLTNYLIRIWNLLRKLSSEFHSKRQTGHNPGQWKNYKGVSPKTPSGVGTDYRHEIFGRIYNFMKIKHTHRMKKWWPRIVAFMQKLQEFRKGKLLDDESELNTAFRALDCAYNVYHEKQNISYRDSHWKDLYTLLECATQRITKLTQDTPEFFENVAKMIGK